MQPSQPSFAAALLGAALALGAGAAQAQTRVGGDIKYHIDPGTAEADKGFELRLLSYQFTCSTEFDMLGVYVDKGGITLTFWDQEIPKPCPRIYQPYGPTFEMPALKAGRYSVTTSRLPPCAPQKCVMLPEFGSAGTLIVGTDGKNTWFVEPRVAGPKLPFTLSLLNHAYGSCNTEFTHAGMQFTDGNIDISFVIENHPERICAKDTRPWGASFEKVTLASGIYPVRLQIMPACAFTMPVCDMAWMPQVVDTLVITGPLGVAPPRATPGASRALLRNGQVGLPASGGASGFTYFSLLGRLLPGRR